MNNWKKHWERLKAIRGLVSAARLLIWIWPFAVTALAYLLAVADQLPISSVIPLALVTLAAAVTLTNQIGLLFGRPLATRQSQEYAYGLALTSVPIAYEPWQQGGVLQISLNLTNCVQGPIEYCVERFDLLVHDRAVLGGKFQSRRGVVRAGAANLFMHPPYPRESIEPLMEQKVSGAIELDIAYGPPGQRPIRRLRMKLAVTLNLFQDRQKGGLGYLIVEESDVSAHLAD